MKPGIEIGVHALLITFDRKILLVSKGTSYTYDKRNAGKVTMFGGRVENGEDLRTSLRRELLEEIGLEFSLDRFNELNTYRKTKERDGCDVEVHVFVIYGIDHNTVRISKEDLSSEFPDVNETVIEGMAEEHLLRPDLTRITMLALEDFINTPPCNQGA